jgi:hypothetical protein
VILLEGIPICINHKARAFLIIVTFGRFENGEEKMHVFKLVQWQEKKPIVVVQVCR